MMPQVYRRSSESAVASYDFFDLSTSIGYKRFFLTKLSGSSILAVKEVGSEYVFTSLGAVGQTSIDFDFEFKSPMVVDGNAHIVIPHVQNAGGSNSRVDVIIKKVDVNNVVTTLTYLSGSAFAPAATAAYGQYSNFRPDIPKTKFKVGEKIRLTVDLNVFSYQAGTLVCIGHDALGRQKDANSNPTSNDWSSTNYIQTIDSVATFDCPFVVDI